ncbi:MAG: class I SAM-dependent methyltransferase, partial [Candidatus Binatia bacterium]
MSANDTSQPSFIPALGSSWLTPLYDTVSWLIGERALKRTLIRQAQIAPGADVLDLGCGTGTLALLIKEMQPAANVSGVDIDPQILAIARGKIAAAGVEIRLVEGSATAPPLPPASFDRVLSTLMLHHL